MTDEEKETQLQRTANSNAPSLAFLFHFRQLQSFLYFYVWDYVIFTCCRHNVYGNGCQRYLYKELRGAQRKLDASRQTDFTANQLKNVLKAAGFLILRSVMNDQQIISIAGPLLFKICNFKIRFLKYTFSSCTIPLSGIVKVQIETSKTTVSNTTTQVVLSEQLLSWRYRWWSRSNRRQFNRYRNKQPGYPHRHLGKN